jgi:PIN domain nuclease of toxin-antitoxin system
MRDRISEADRVGVSAISCWEVVMLQQRQRIDLPMSAQQWLHHALSPAGIERLPVSCEIAALSAALSQHHKDPADRIIIATALTYRAHLYSLDARFADYEELSEMLVQH